MLDDVIDLPLNDHSSLGILTSSRLLMLSQSFWSRQYMEALDDPVNIVCLINSSTNSI